MHTVLIFSLVGVIASLGGVTIASMCTDLAVLTLLTANTMEPLNKGHVQDNINSPVLSFVERLFSSRRL